MRHKRFQLLNKKFDAFQADFHISDNDQALYDWSSKQTYIALGNMMTTAALLGIDSCPMEGFSLDTVTDILANKGILDTEQFGLSVMVAFGYRQQEPPKKKHAKLMKMLLNGLDQKNKIEYRMSKYIKIKS